jgi:Mn-dependent DtxR family transcriptional regulator
MGGFLNTLAVDYSLIQKRKRVVRVLLEQAANMISRRGRLSQRDIAVMAGTNWPTVHKSLEYLQHEGAIRFERNHMIINRQLLEKLAGP